MCHQRYGTLFSDIWNYQYHTINFACSQFLVITGDHLENNFRVTVYFRPALLHMLHTHICSGHIARTEYKTEAGIENVDYFNQCGGVMGWCGFELSFAKRKTSSLTKRICVPIEEPGDVIHPRFKSQGARLWAQIGPLSYKEPHVMYNGWIKKRKDKLWNVLQRILKEESKEKR